MANSPLELNLVIAWVWITVGFIFGSVMGLFFHKEDWMGGYGSFRRRLYRLGHVSFFGLAIINLLFYFTVQSLALEGQLVRVASYGFVAGAITMPVCCFIMAHVPRLQPLFAIPVLSLIVSAILLLREILAA